MFSSILYMVVGLIYVWNTDGQLIGNKRLDCIVSSWTEWSETFGFGVKEKTRVVLRYPANGGQPCPIDLKQEIYTAEKPTIASTSKKIIVSFLNHQTETDGIQRRSNGRFRDLLLIMDSSSSIGTSHFNLAKNRIAELLGYVCPVSDPFRRDFNRAALIKFSTGVTEEFDFDDNSNTAEVQSAIKLIQYQGGSTCTGDAFEKAITMFVANKGMRADTEHEVLIMSDGRSNCGAHIPTVLSTLKTKATIFGLFVGDFDLVGKTELLSYVSEPAYDHLFAVDNFQDLDTLLNLIREHVNQYPCAPFNIGG